MNQKSLRAFFHAPLQLLSVAMDGKGGNTKGLKLDHRKYITVCSPCQNPFDIFLTVFEEH